MAFVSASDLRRAFLRAFVRTVLITWPILSALLVLMACLGAVTGLMEGWGVAKGIYFAYITGLTIGYGDLVPRQPLTQVIAVLIGFCGIILTGLVAGLAVAALQSMRNPQPQPG
jgi:hypothetical protein